MPVLPLVLPVLPLVLPVLPPVQSPVVSCRMRGPIDVVVIMAVPRLIIRKTAVGGLDANVDGTWPVASAAHSTLLHPVPLTFATFGFGV